jgi:hypothetical protein
LIDTGIAGPLLDGATASLPPQDETARALKTQQQARVDEVRCGRIREIALERRFNEYRKCPTRQIGENANCRSWELS